MRKLSFTIILIICITASSLIFYNMKQIKDFEKENNSLKYELKTLEKDNTSLSDEKSQLDASKMDLENKINEIKGN